MSMFELGTPLATNGVSLKMKEDEGFKIFVKKSFDRYINRDWGDTCDEDKKLNDEALENGGRILAVYKHSKYSTIWIITEWDRSATTILFPHEY